MNQLKQYCLIWLGKKLLTSIENEMRSIDTQ